jgi:hypothetical protein
MEQIMISIGQEAAVVHQGTWDDTIHYCFGYVVTKVSPTDQVTITHTDGHERQFGKDGYEIGISSTPSSPSWLHRDTVRFDVTELELRGLAARARRASLAAQMINSIDKPKHVTRHNSTKSMHTVLDAMQKMIDDARKSVDSVDSV